MPIFLQVIFDRAQAIRKHRKSLHAGKTSGKKPLSGKIYCGCSGAIYRYKSVNQRNDWICTKQDESKNLYSVKPVAEAEIYSTFLRLDKNAALFSGFCALYGTIVNTTELTLDEPKVL